MARKVRGIRIEQPIEAIYNAAIYARKSVDDEESLEIQISMLKEYVNESDDLLLYKVFSDNGFTGVDFNRPSFQKMIEEMKLGRFNTIVVKDSSRLGRNYLETGAYIETEFPQYGIRFISVNDRYDSQKMECKNDGISLPLKNIMNEQYSKDLSRKLSPVFRVRQMDGKFIGGITTYGYLKDENDRNKLVADPETAPIVRRIFESKVKGMSDGAIAKELNGEGIQSPFTYRYSKGFVKSEKYRDLPWQRGTIAQIIVNPMYLGNMVQGRSRQSLSLHESKHRTPENEWIVVEDTHEAIVDKELYDAVQLIIQKRKKKYHQQNCNSGEPVINLLKGKVFCGDCGRAMELTKSKSAVATNRYYRCKLYNETAGDRCSLKSIKKEMLESLTLEVIRSHMKLYCNTEALIHQINTSEKAGRKLEECKTKLDNLSAEWQKKVTLANGLHKDYEEKLLNYEEYLFLQEEYDGKIKMLGEQIGQLKKYANTYQADVTISKEWSKKIRAFILMEELNREMIETFISRIEITGAAQVIIKMNCADAIEHLCQITGERGGECYNNYK